MNSPHLTIRRHLSCCGRVITVSAFATACNPNPLDVIREVLARKVAQHDCEETIPFSIGNSHQGKTA